MNQKLDYEAPPREQVALRVRIWNGLGLAAAIVVAIDVVSGLLLIAMPRPFHWTVIGASIFVLAWLLNRYFLLPMREAMHEAKRNRKEL